VAEQLSSPGAPTPDAERTWRDLKSQSLTPPDVLSGRIPIFDVEPNVEAGRRPAKAVAGEQVKVSATVFREGHDLIGVSVVLRDPTGSVVATERMHSVGAGLDRWAGEIRPTTPGDWTFTIQGWADPIATWIHRAHIKIPAGLDVDLELTEGSLLFDRAAATATNPDVRAAYATAAAALRDGTQTVEERLDVATSDDLTDLFAEHPLRDLVTDCGPWPLRVDRRRALVGSWYEMFPRSEGATGEPLVSGTFASASARLEAIAAMDFDVVYLPPIHPIGEINRKGPNNSTEAGPQDPGSPWAIGSAQGGHDTVHPDLGTLADFDRFVATAKSLDLEIALDLALQVAPDHPWATEGKPWFLVRADGTIAFAENPPKKYQDIYPMWFDSDPQGLIDEVLRIIQFWADRGVRIFRVDNPHTKPVRFWDAVLAEVYRTDPDILFLAEAFTRPPMMRALAEVGFHQSYSYFTWRNEKWEIEEYFTELSHDAAAHMRPNLFVNTPDILPAFLQYGGPAAFAIRATLAATLAPTWGVYAGFELFEHVAVKAGSEEYLNSEKYELRPRDWEGAAASGNTLAGYITLLNKTRRGHPALQTLRGLTFHSVDNEKLIAYSRQDGADIIIVICTLDPYGVQEATVHFDMAALGFEWSSDFRAHDEVTNSSWVWNANPYIRIDPNHACAHIVRVQRGTV
jgi:starch synthase (maltosyl-transferring)